MSREEKNVTNQILQDLYSMINNVPGEDAPEMKKEALEDLHALDKKLACQYRAEIDFEKQIQPIIADLFKDDDLLVQDGAVDDPSSDEYDSEDDEKTEETVVAAPRKLNEEIGQKELLNIMRKTYKSIVDGYKDDDLKFVLEDLVPTNSINEEDSGKKDNDDDNLDATIVYINIDPITKRKIQVPVRNPKCKHVYCRNSIVVFLSNRPDGIKCPYSFCASQQLFKIDDLLDFPEFFDLCAEVKEEDDDTTSFTTTH